MALDYYSEAGKVIEALAAEGLASEASSLREAMANGATGTEILMALRWNLQQIDRDNKSTNLATKRSIRDLLKELDAVLS